MEEADIIEPGGSVAMRLIVNTWRRRWPENDPRAQMPHANVATASAPRSGIPCPVRSSQA